LLTKTKTTVKEAAENGEIPLHPEDVYNQRAARQAMDRMSTTLFPFYY
jgi:hypothetical protein